jgi:predicted RNA-binding protein Jag
VSTYTGKNLETALQKASAALGVAAEAIRYEILAGKNGGYALIRVTGQGAPAAAPTTSLVESLSGDPNTAVAREPRADRPDRGDRGDRGPRPDRGDRGDRGPRGGGDRGDRGPRGGGDRGPRPDRGGDRGDRGPRSGGDRGGDRRRRDDRDELLPVPQDGPTEVTVELREDAPLGEFGLKVKDYLVGVLQRMGFGVKVILGEGPDEVYADLVTSHYHDAFVARELELLDSVEHLVEKAALGHGNLPEGAHKKKLNLDCNGFRARADVDLANSARQMAQRAIDENRVFKIGPLDPRARRVVHLTLRDLPGVATKSEGEGVFRRVCLIPRSAPDDTVTSVPADTDEPSEA